MLVDFYEYILRLRGYTSNWPLLILGGTKSTPSLEIDSLNLLWKRLSNTS